MPARTNRYRAMTLPTASSVLAVLSAHPSRETWASAVRESALDAYARRERSVRIADPTRIEGDSLTPYGDLKELLAREPQNDTERWTLGALRPSLPAWVLMGLVAATLAIFLPRDWWTGMLLSMAASILVLPELASAISK